MSRNIIEVPAPNTVEVVSPKSTIETAVVNETVISSSQCRAIEVPSALALSLSNLNVALDAQPDKINIVEVGGTVSDHIEVLNKAERKDLVEDSPSAGDITQYYGVAAPFSANDDAVWLVSRQIFTKDGGVFDAEKKFASKGYDKTWDGRLSHIYT